MDESTCTPGKVPLIGPDQGKCTHWPWWGVTGPNPHFRDCINRVSRALLAVGHQVRVLPQREPRSQCPRYSDTALLLSPASSSTDAQWCRRACVPFSRLRGMPATSSAGGWIGRVWRGGHAAGVGRAERSGAWGAGGNPRRAEGARSTDGRVDLYAGFCPPPERRGGHPSRPAVAGRLQRSTRRLGRVALERLRRPGPWAPALSTLLRVGFT